MRHAFTQDIVARAKSQLDLVHSTGYSSASGLECMEEEDILLLMAKSHFRALVTSRTEDFEKDIFIMHEGDNLARAVPSKTGTASRT